jgi:hypothetical protein
VFIAVNPPFPIRALKPRYILVFVERSADELTLFTLDPGQIVFCHFFTPFAVCKRQMLSLAMNLLNEQQAHSACCTWENTEWRKEEIRGPSGTSGSTVTRHD